MAGEPSFLEIGVPNGSHAREFYEKLFGWTFHDMTGDNFWIETPTLRAGLHPDDDTRVIGVYFSVPDIEAAIERVRELGGEAHLRADGDGAERFAECRDNQGVYFGLHQPAGGD